MGVRDHFTTQHYAAGLRELARAASGQPLDDARLAVALQLADCAAEAQRHYGRSTLALYVPDSEGVMMPAGQLLYNDAKWCVLRSRALPAVPWLVAEECVLRKC